MITVAIITCFIPQGEAFAREHGLIFMETSAKTAANVEEVISISLHCQKKNNNSAHLCKFPVESMCTVGASYCIWYVLSVLLY